MSFKLKLSLIGFALVFTGFIFFYHNFSPLADSIPDNSSSKTWFKFGSYEVDLYQEIMVDESRTTPVNGDYAGSAQRALEVHVWVPKSANTKSPLIIYSHGFVSTWRGGAYLAEHLASRGYVVAAPDFPLTNWYAPGGPNITDIVNQPGDVSFIIDTILKQSSSKHHRLFELVDSKKIKESELINTDLLRNVGLINKNSVSVKLLAKGTLTTKLKIEISSASEKAKKLVEDCGGSLTLV